ncbi:hypothetical protein C0Z22_10590 [Halobacteriovorax sp. DA5]|nr:hypothetical protein C0Z22_10590 [Halobacteriovorax sp. DA5]
MCNIMLPIGEIMKLFIAFILSFNVFCHELEYQNYLSLQKSLVEGNLDQGLKSWKTMCKKELGHYAKDYKYGDCDKNIKSVSALRDSFKLLSEIYIKNGKSLENSDLKIVKCPMAKARWIQKGSSVKNPYYGKKMLTCGEVES